MFRSTPRSHWGSIVCVFAIGSAVVSMARAADGQPSDAWLKSVTASIGAAEYQFTQRGDAWMAPNRAHNLRLAFDARGMRVTPRTTPGREFVLELRTSAFGRDGALVDQSDGALSAQGARLTIARSQLIEWYENDARGVEQGFTVLAPPAVTGGSLVIEMTARGLRPSLNDAGDALTFIADDGTAMLVYAGLKVWDERGR